MGKSANFYELKTQISIKEVKEHLEGFWMASHKYQFIITKSIIK